MEQSVRGKIKRFGKAGRVISVALMVMIGLLAAALLYSTVELSRWLPESRVHAYESRTVRIETDSPVVWALMVNLVDGKDMAVNGRVLSGERAYVYDLAALRWVVAAVIAHLGCVCFALLHLKWLMRELERCDTPFSPWVVRQMREFAFALIPAVVMGKVAGNLSRWFRAGGGSFTPDTDLSGAIVVAVVLALVTIFQYGAQLQRESDETL